MPKFFPFAIIENKTKSLSIQTPIETCDDMPSRMRGLMFRKKPASLLFDFEYEDFHAIHSYFVNFEFDAIFLDENFIAVDIFHAIETFKPLVKPKKKCKYLLELPCGFIQRLGAHTGDEFFVSDGHGKKI